MERLEEALPFANLRVMKSVTASTTGFARLTTPSLSTKITWRLTCEVRISSRSPRTARFKPRLKADDTPDSTAHPDCGCRRGFCFDVAAVKPLAVSHSHTQGTPMAGGLSLFKNSGTGLFTRDDSILASSLLLAGNSLMNRSSEPSSTSTSTPTTATQFYSQFQNYYHLHENDIFPSSLIPPPSTTTIPTATCGEGYSSQMPNLTASLLRSRSDSLSRRASEPNLQKFGASVDNFSAAAAAAAAVAAAASATADRGIMVQQKNTTEQLVRALRGNLLLEGDSSLTATTATSTAQPPTQTSSETELYQSPMQGASQVYDEDTEDIVDDDESTIFVQESNGNRNSNGGEDGTGTKSHNKITTTIAMTQS
ncbi:hypothetical protein EGR_09134 [Echinococcus granulosus]|uniref:Uncharacterized protein n=1 Tax=Echinococcus granulosus TaxID=6210 RepID=W6URK4_ECHGR|nr:hypothetical protein EGR_09134 [Echinococcus granulosus]EUB56009.1 hypothetical protein EGR_09134 [Echinococcus granulosus]